MPYALFSVYDKTGLVDLARALQALGWSLIASGHTAQHLRDHHLPVISVSEYTKSPEILKGRVKTLHPAIHGGLLARDNQADHEELLQHGWHEIDLAVVNLYPFEATVAQPDVTHEAAIEQIDIGGVALIRAAAKNHDRVTLLCDPEDYSTVMEELKRGKVAYETRKKLAIKGFTVSSRYDAAIANYLSPEKSTNLPLYLVQNLRYGENPHQQATLYSWVPHQGPLGGRLLQGKELSYNNLLDIDAAWRAVVGFERPSIAIVKHLSPSGIASADHLATAYQLALACDPISAFGGIIASNQCFNVEVAQALGELFIECIVAPAFAEEAREILAKRPNCRLLEIPSLELYPHEEWRSVNQGLLKQTMDQGDPVNTNWRVVTKRQPTLEEMQALKFAWRAAQHVKSNAIVLVKGETTVGIGGGQPNRVDCVHLAANRAGDRARGAVMASDAFLPFADVVEAAAQHGITAVIQPGGSIRDELAILEADKQNIAMVMTGVRHFKH